MICTAGSAGVSGGPLALLLHHRTDLTRDLSLDALVGGGVCFTELGNVSADAGDARRENRLRLAARRRRERHAGVEGCWLRLARKQSQRERARPPWHREYLVGA